MAHGLTLTDSDLLPCCCVLRHDRQAEEDVEQHQDEEEDVRPHDDLMDGLLDFAAWENDVERSLGEALGMEAELSGSEAEAQPAGPHVFEEAQATQAQAQSDGTPAAAPAAAASAPEWPEPVGGQPFGSAPLEVAPRRRTEVDAANSVWVVEPGGSGGGPLTRTRVGSLKFVASRTQNDPGGNALRARCCFHDGCVVMMTGREQWVELGLALEDWPAKGISLTREQHQASRFEVYQALGRPPPRLRA